MKVPHSFSVVFLLIALVALCSQAATAKDEWTQVRSRNFFLIGNAPEKEIRKVATRLEQFRETFRLVFAKMNLVSPIPTNVVVFKSASSYKNFKPKRADGKIDTFVAGYFQPSEDVNYITLSTEGDDADMYGTIFHEYVHFIVSTNFGKSEVPPWFNEGLAEYYQTFQIIDDQKVRLGVAQGGHLSLLRQTDLMPLDRLFNVSNYQLHQTGSHSRSIFYAQSWALLHYLLQSGKADGLSKFMASIIAGTKPQKAFSDAFETDYSQMEKDLRKYVSKSQYQYHELTFKMKLVFDADMTTTPMTDADSNAYLGDLLYHTNRPDDAEPFLQAALKLEPGSSVATTSLGMVKLKQRKFDEARPLLEKAISSDRTNHLALYYYAYLLSRQGRDEFGLVQGFDGETSAKMRDALKKAIAVTPSFTESYELLAFVNLVNGEAFDESVDLLRSALKYQPGNQRYMMRIAELLMRQDKLADAQAIADKIARTAEDQQMRSRADQLISEITRRKQFLERPVAGRSSLGSSGPDRERPMIRRRPQQQPTEAELAKREEVAMLRSINEVLRKTKDGEQRVLGRIQKIDCTARPIIYTIKTESETFTLTSTDFQGLTLSAYDPRSTNVQVGCDEDISAQMAILTYRTVATSKVRGELNVVEFVPADFRFLSEEEMRQPSGVLYSQTEEDDDAGPAPPPRSAPTGADMDARRRAMMMESIRNELRRPNEGEKREIGFLEKIECTRKGVFFHLRTSSLTLRLLNASPESLHIRVFAPDLDGLQFGCTLKPVTFPAVFVYTDKPDPKAKTAGEIVAIDFVPKTFTVE